MTNSLLLLLAATLVSLCLPPCTVATLVAPMWNQRYPNNSIVHVALIMIESTGGNILGQQVRDRAVNQLLSRWNITVQSHLLLVTQTSPALLHSLNIIHATVNVPTASFDASLPLNAANITFSFLTPPPDANLMLPNVEYNIVPAANMGAEIGMLAGLVSVSKTIAVWYGPFEARILPGVRAGVNLTCPDCTVSGYFLCSGSVVCAGELKQTYASATDADIVVTAYSQANVLPLTIFQQNQQLANTSSPSGDRYKKVIIFGNLGGDLSTAVVSHNDTLGCLALDQKGAVPRAVADVVLGVFDPTVRNAPSYWISPYFSSIRNGSAGVNLSTSRGVTITSDQLAEFTQLRRLFLGGAVNPQYDTAGQLEGYAALAGGRPLLPIGRVANGLPHTSFDTLSSFFDLKDDAAAVCVLGARTLVVDATLSMLNIFNAENGQFLSTALDVLTPADYVSGAAATATSALYNASRRILYPTTGLRRHIACVTTSDALVITTKVLSSPSVGGTGWLETLRLAPICVAPSNTGCDFFLLENMTAALLPAVQHVGGLSFQMPFNSSVTFFTNCSLPHPIGSTGCWIRTSAFTVLGTVRLAAPPQAGAVFQLTQHLFVAASGNGGGAVLALDPARNVVCRLNVQDVNDAAVASQFGRLPPAVDLAWTDDTSPVPSAGGSVLCLFYIASSKRLGVVTSGGSESHQPQVYHYSYLLSAWILQVGLQYASNNVSANWSYRCMSLPGGAGGSALIIPEGSGAEVSRLTTLLYPTVIPSCSAQEGSVLAPSQQTCINCDAGTYATRDGYCATVADPAAGSDLEPWMIVVITLFAAAVGAGALLAVAPLVRRQFSPWTRARNALNAPEVGSLGCALSIAVAGADLLWNEVSASDDDDLDASAVHQRPKPRRVVGGPEYMRKAMDVLASVVLERTAANRCYLSSFRGDEAVVVSKSATRLLCLAVEISFELSQRPSPLQVTCGLHLATLSAVQFATMAAHNPLEQSPPHKAIRTSNPAISRVNAHIMYAGEAVTVAHAARQKSTRGRIIATQAYIDSIDDAVLKVLALTYGSASTHQVGGVVHHMRELIVPFVSSAFDKSSDAFEQARQRRRAKLRGNRRRVRESLCHKSEQQRHDSQFLLRSQCEGSGNDPPMENPSSPRIALQEPTLSLPSASTKPPLVPVNSAGDQLVTDKSSTLIGSSAMLPRSSLEAAMFGLAAVVSRTILSDLGSATVDGGSAAFAVISSRLHLPSRQRKQKDDVDAKFVPPEVIKTLSRRMVQNTSATELLSGPTRLEQTTKPGTSASAPPPLPPSSDSCATNSPQIVVQHDT